MNKVAPSAAQRTRRVARDVKGRIDAAGQPDEAESIADERQDRMRAVREVIRATKLPDPVPARPQVRAAMMASPRVTRALAWEWDLVVLEAQASIDPAVVAGADLLLIEVSGDRVPGWGSPGGAPRGVAEAARANGVPVALWVTMASRHPESAAALVPLATAIFIAEADSLPAWRDRWPESHVEELAPAAAPRLHSPAHGGLGVQRAGDVAMLADDVSLDEVAQAGLETVLGSATRMSALPELHLWRPKKEPGIDQAHTPLPVPARKSVVAGTVIDAAEPVVDHYRVVVDAARTSPGSSWTVLDAGAAQTAVVSLPEYHATLPEDVRRHVATAADGIRFGREIVALAGQAQLRDRESLKLRRAVLGAHTIGHRADAILTTLGRPAPALDRSVSAVVPTNREHQIDNVLANVARQVHRDLELILVLHGLSTAEAELRARAAERGIDRLHVVHADRSLPLGAVMNLGVDVAGGRYVAKMDDDNFYGRYYLTDLINAFAGTGAGVVGKWSHYVWLRSTDAVVLRYADFENRYHRLVQGGSIMVERELADDFRFSDIPRAVDTDFLNRLWAAGVATYSADRFNFVSVRGTDRQQHTWKVTDTEMLVGGADVAFYGDPRTHVEV